MITSISKAFTDCIFSDKKQIVEIAEKSKESEEVCLPTFLLFVLIMLNQKQIGSVLKFRVRNFVS